jgi:tetratricopeptide (TPR) repeat protein
MNLRVCSIVVAVSLLSHAAPSSAAEPGAVASAKLALQQGVNHGSAEDVLKARAQFEVLAAAEPKVAAYPYWIAVADWRATPLLGADRVKAARYCHDGLTRVDQALALAPNDAEIIALKGGLQGMSIQFDAGSMMTLGPQSMANLRRALSLAPSSPRVWLLEGIGTLNRPAQYGGGATAATDELERALAVSAADSAANESAADWGRDDAALWAGRAAMLRQDYPAAVDRFRRALSINPSNGWVKKTLLPDAERALAAGATGHGPPAAAGAARSDSAAAGATTSGTKSQP